MDKPTVCHCDVVIEVTAALIPGCQVSPRLFSMSCGITLSIYLWRLHYSVMSCLQQMVIVPSRYSQYLSSPVNLCIALNQSTSSTVLCLFKVLLFWNIVQRTVNITVSHKNSGSGY